MIFPILLLLFASIAIFCHAMKWKNSAIGFWVADFVTIIVVVIIAGIALSCNNYEIQCLNVMENKVKIYENQRDNLQKQYKQLLDTNYNKYESGLFDKMTNVNKSAMSAKGEVSINVLPQYPQTKYQPSLIALVVRMDSLNSLVYNSQIEIQDKIASIKIYRGNIWLPAFIYRDVPDEYQNYVVVQPIK